MFDKIISLFKNTGPTNTPLDVLEPTGEYPDVRADDLEDYVGEDAPWFRRLYAGDWIDAVHDHVGEEDDYS